MPFACRRVSGDPFVHLIWRGDVSRTPLFILQEGLRGDEQIISPSFTKYNPM